MRALAILFLAGCSSSAPKCPGAAPQTLLYEDYCQHGEAARCNYDQSLLDGF
jgi:outer membrane biogenesis lipoprotein LolB